MGYTGRVIIPESLKGSLNEREVGAALTLAKHYQQDVEFIVTARGYKMKSADIVLNGKIYEVKCPEGNSRNTIKSHLKRASRQSKMVVIDVRHTKLPESGVIAECTAKLASRSRVKEIIIITKSHKVLELRK